MKVLVLNPSSKFIKNVCRDLIYGCWCKGNRIGGATFPPTSLLYIATVLKKEGHDVNLFDAIVEKNSQEYIEKYIKNCDIVIISTSTMSFNEDVDILYDLKKINESLTTLVFGSHPTFMPYHSLKKDAVDVIIRREPEFIIRDLVNALERDGDSWKSIRGIGYKDNGKMILNSFYPLIENLDEIPFIDRGILPKNVEYFNPLVDRMPFTTLMTSRGCPGRCTFCTVPSFYGHKIRYRSSSIVLDELELIESQGYKEVWFRDETFTAFKKRNEEICRGIIGRDIDLTWICNARIGMVDKETMNSMKMAGCHMIKFGVESGVQRILDNINKGIKVEETRCTFKLAHDVGMDTHGHIMLGNPGESKETIEETIKFVKDINPTTVSFGICTPYPGSGLFKYISTEHTEIEDGTSCDLSKLHETAFFNEFFTDLSSEELKYYVKKAYRSFYLRPRYIIKWMGRVKNVQKLKRVISAGLDISKFGAGID